MYDVLPFPPQKDAWQHTALWQHVEGVFRGVCHRFGYREIRTPIVEATELFTRNIGKGTDIVSKEMFSFQDRGERDISLKPEGTASVVRACLENSLFNDYPTLKLYYIGQNFRAERGQKGRYRQHQQLGVEVFGVSDAQVDAEVIALAMTFYNEVGITDCDLRINSVGTPESRQAYGEALRDYVRPFLSEMSEDGQRRFEVNPLRMLDTKDKSDLKLLEEAPHLVDYLDPESRDHFDRVQGYLTALGIPHSLDHRLVRGFDYYTRTAFEIAGRHLGAQSALGGGGRYDGLVKDCGGPSVPGIGFGLGMERCLITLEEMGVQIPLGNSRPDIFLIVLGDTPALLERSMQILQELRLAGFAADRDFRSKKFPPQVKQADLLGARYTLILGEDELAKGIAQLRNQETKAQEEIALSELVATLKARLR
jgi:histidyl-tRNA synthetase